MPFVLVLVLAPLLAYGIVTFVTRGGDLPIGGSDDKPLPAATATSKAPETEDDSEEPEEPATPPEDDTQDESPAAEPDLATSVTVFNAAGIQGLAATAGQKLTTAGSRP